MERHTVFIDWKTQHSKEVNSPQTVVMPFLSKPPQFFIEMSFSQKLYRKKNTL